MSAVWLRFLLILEFLVAVPAIFAAWSQIGGQGHLDLMPWYWKLLGLAAAGSAVMFTSAAMRRERWATPRSVAWLLVFLIIAIAMGGATYYYHLRENQDDVEQEESTTALQSTPDLTRAGDRV